MQCLNRSRAKSPPNDDNDDDDDDDEIRYGLCCVSSLPHLYHRCVCVCARARARLNVCVCSFMCVRACVRARAHVRMYVCVCVCVCVRQCVCHLFCDHMWQWQLCPQSACRTSLIDRLLRVISNAVTFLSTTYGSETIGSFHWLAETHLHYQESKLKAAKCQGL